LEYVEDKAFLNGLLHRVTVEGPMLDGVPFRVRLAENFKRCKMHQTATNLKQPFAWISIPHVLLNGISHGTSSGRGEKSFAPTARDRIFRWPTIMVSPCPVGAKDFSPIRQHRIEVLDDSL